MKYICKPAYAFQLLGGPRMEVEAEQNGDEYTVVYLDATGETIESSRFERMYRLKPA